MGDGEMTYEDYTEDERYYIENRSNYRGHPKQKVIFTSQIQQITNRKE